jgi:hypothetical protein
MFLAVYLISVSYRPVADDYQQVLNVLNMSPVQNIQTIRSVLDSSPFGSASYALVYEFLANTSLANWTMIIFIQFLIGVGLVTSVLSNCLSTTHNRKVSNVFCLIALTILILVCFGPEQRSYMSFTWTASFLAHTVPELAMYILGLHIFRRRPIKEIRIRIFLLTLIVAFWGGIDPLISFATLFALLFAIIAQQMSRGRSFREAKKNIGSYIYVYGIALIGVLALILGRSVSHRVKYSDFQLSNSGSLLNRFIGIGLLSFRENFILNLLGITLAFATGFLIKALFDKFNIVATFSTRVILVLVFMFFIRKILLIAIESFSYFGVWHHGTSSIILLCIVFMSGFKTYELSRKNWKILPVLSILVLSLQIMIVNDIHHQTVKLAVAWDLNSLKNLQGCSQEKYLSNFQFSEFLDSPKTTEWQKYMCKKTSQFRFSKVANSGVGASYLFGIQDSIKKKYDVELLKRVNDLETRAALRRQLY